MPSWACGGALPVGAADPAARLWRIWPRGGGGGGVGGLAAPRSRGRVARIRRRRAVRLGLRLRDGGRRRGEGRGGDGGRLRCVV